MKKTLIVVAGGRGIRMGSELPKQFLYLRGRPILMQTLDLFHRYDPGIPIVLGLPEAYMEYWEDLCRKMDFNIPHRITPGGKTRFYTVRKALQQAVPGSMIAVHDAVRPFASRDTIDRCFDAAGKEGAAIPCVEVPGSLREVRQGKSVWVDRQFYRLVQTPQVFDHDILIRSYRQAYEDAFTDDASVVEKAGFPVSLVEGNRENLKITTPEDLVYAEALWDSFREKSGLY